MDLNQELRAKTLANNLIWLRSFGCEIERGPDIIQVTHPHIPEYNAHMIVGWEAETRARLRSLLTGNDKSPTLYVDEPFISDANPLLSHYQLQPTCSSRVKCTQLKFNRKAAGNIMLRRAESPDLEKWSKMYSEGFRRKDSESIDRKRWQRSFANPAISHWFFTELGRDFGVMQTCSAEGVVGIYSVMLLPECRALRRIFTLGKVLRFELWQQGARTIYFERVKRRVWTQPSLAPMFRQLKTVRKFLVYMKKTANQTNPQH